MKLIKIDPLKLQTLETFIDALLEILRVTLRHPLGGSGSYLTALCRDDESFRIRIEGFCDEQFISFGSVSIGCVDQIHAEIDRASQNLERVPAIGRPTPEHLAR